MYRIGDIEIYLFNDAVTSFDPGGLFGLVPRALWSRHYPADERHLVKAANHNLLIRSGQCNIIVDTGYGNCATASQRKHSHMTAMDGTHKGLAALGIAPADINIVLDTHLHDDHCTGNFRRDADGARKPAFPNAEYLVQRREYEDASAPNERTRATYSAKNFASLYNSGQMHLLDGDAEIAPGVRAQLTPGHTPGHMSVRIESGGQQAAFLCDLASLAIHFERLAWMTAYDVEPLVTLETKRIWQRWALETKALLVFPHDLLMPAGRLSQTESGRLKIQPVDLSADNLADA